MEVAEVGGEAPRPPGHSWSSAPLRLVNYIFVMPLCLSVSIQAASLGCYVYVN